MTTTPVTVSAANPADAVARCAKHTNKVDGFTVTGRVSVKSERHGLYTVEVAGHGDRNDLWVVLTSYGMNPGKELGSVWQTVEGIGA